MSRNRTEAKIPVRRRARGQSPHPEGHTARNSVALHLRSQVFDGVRLDEIASLFGEDFARAVLALPPGRWSGPIASAYGAHLVMLTGRTEQPTPPLDQIRDMVREEWLASRAQEQRDRFYGEVRQRYAVTVERPASALAAAAVPETLR